MHIRPRVYMHFIHTRRYRQQLGQPRRIAAESPSPIRVSVHTSAYVCTYARLYSYIYARASSSIFSFHLFLLFLSLSLSLILYLLCVYVRVRVCVRVCVSVYVRIRIDW